MNTAKKVLASFVIADFLALQAVAGFKDTGKALWPFLAYPMYSWPKHYGDVFNRYEIFAVLDDGRESPVTPEDLHLGFWEYLWGPVDAIEHDEAAKIGVYLKQDGALGARHVAAVRLENDHLLFTPRGWARMPPETVKLVHLQ